MFKKLTLELLYTIILVFLTVSVQSINQARENVIRFFQLKYLTLHITDQIAQAWLSYLNLPY